MLHRKEFISPQCRIGVDNIPHFDNKARHLRAENIARDQARCPRLLAGLAKQPFERSPFSVTP